MLILGFSSSGYSSNEDSLDFDGPIYNGLHDSILSEQNSFTVMNGIRVSITNYIL